MPTSRGIAIIGIGADPMDEEHAQLAKQAGCTRVAPWQHISIEPKSEVWLSGFRDITRWQIGNVRKCNFMDIRNSDPIVGQRGQFLRQGYAESCRRAYCAGLVAAFEIGTPHRIGRGVLSRKTSMVAP